MPPKSLFLLSGRSGFELVADEFVPKAGGSKASIALLLFVNNDKTPTYVAEYADPWQKRGIASYTVVMPTTSGELDLEDATRRIAGATGIFIGGGDTARYRELFATKPIAQLIRDKYKDGVPLAGCSAGALIAMEHCLLYDYDSDKLDIKPGLGLLREPVIDVHFSERERLKPLLVSMKKIGLKRGLGIDEAACAVFVNGELDHCLGKSVYQIHVKDFETMAFEEKVL
jgi:cyanophycinase